MSEITLTENEKDIIEEWFNSRELFLVDSNAGCPDQSEMNLIKKIRAYPETKQDIKPPSYNERQTEKWGVEFDEWTDSLLRAAGIAWAYHNNNGAPAYAIYERGNLDLFFSWDAFSTRIDIITLGLKFDQACEYLQRAYMDSVFSEGVDPEVSAFLTRWRNSIDGAENENS